MANKSAWRFWVRLCVASVLIYLFYTLFGIIDPWRPPPSHKHEPAHGHEELPAPIITSLAEDTSTTTTTATTTAPTAIAATLATSIQPSDAVSDVASSKWTVKEYNDTTLPPITIRHRVLTNADYQYSKTSPTLLVLVMTKDSSSWGWGRNLSSFLDMLTWTELDPATISLTLVTSSKEEFESYSSTSTSQALNSDYASLHIVHHPGYSDIGSWRLFRHFGSFQHSRRVEMARLRNYATLTSLELSHEHLLWIDADVYEISPGLVQRMLSFSSVYPQVGIQTAISHYGDDNGDYDFNAWVGMRTTPNAAQREKLRKDKGSWSPDGVPGKIKHMGDLRTEYEQARDEKQHRQLSESSSDEDLPSTSTSAAYEDFNSPDDDGYGDSYGYDNRDEDHIEGLFRLDAVGATLLLIKSHLWRQGLSFATSYLVGTDFQDEGWDGVESEGLCVAARNLINDEYGRQGGVGCWGVVEGYTRHSDS